MMRVISPYTFKWVRGENERNDISALIRESYFQFYNARLSSCMTWLLGMYDAEGKLNAACGIQLASQGALYLEQYTLTPIEIALAAHVASPIARSDIVEVGNFAARDGASARIMYAAICQLLYQYHYSWIVFTGTKKIRNTFYRLNLAPILLMPARLERLGNAAHQWGNYYQHDPQVMAGELVGGHNTLSHNSTLLSLFTTLPDAPWMISSGESYVYKNT